MFPKLTAVKKLVAVSPKKTTMKSSPTTIGTIPRLPVLMFAVIRPIRPSEASGSAVAAGSRGTASAALTPWVLQSPGYRRPSSGRRP